MEGKFERIMPNKHIENYTILQRGIKESLNKCGHEKDNIVKVPIFLKFISRSNAIPMKFSAGILVDINKQILKF